MSAMNQQPPVIESARLSDDGRCLLLSLADSDPEVVAFAKAGGFGPDWAAGTKRVLRLGVNAASIGPYQGTLADMDRAAAQLDALRDLPQQVADRLGGEVGTHLARIVGDAERPGALAAAMDAFIQDTTVRLSKAITPIQERLTGSGPGALPQLLEARLTAALGREASAIVKRVYATDGTSPLMAHLHNEARATQALQQEITGLERRMLGAIAELARQVAVQKAQTPSPADAGREWEPAAIDDVARVTAILGDRVEPVGTRRGHGASLAGDAVLHVADDIVCGLRVAVETRTGTDRLTVKDIRSAMVNRDAHSGLLLADRAELLPTDAQAAGFRVYWSDRVVVLCHERDQPNADQMLTVAVQVSRFLAKEAVSPSGVLAERETLRAVTGRIQTGLAHLKPLRASVTGVHKEADKIYKYAGELDSEIREALTDLTRLAEGL